MLSRRRIDFWSVRYLTVYHESKIRLVKLVQRVQAKTWECEIETTR